MKNLNEIGTLAKKASRELAKLSCAEKNEILLKCAKTLIDNKSKILNANKIDVENGIKNGLKGAIVDRLTLNEKRIEDMADGLIQIANLNDPIGEYTSMKTLPNGMRVGQKRVPMGVIGIIYEARPNVTSDAFGLCLKAGSAVILRGGKEALNSNLAIVNEFKNVIKSIGKNADFVQIIEDTSRETATEMMKLNKYIDVLIPRGGAGLIQAVINNSTVPVIETGTGNCHIFVDKSAKIDDAINIVINAKTRRPGVCNACETLLVHKDIANDFIPKICNALEEKNVEIRGDKIVKEIFPNAVLATDEDFATEFLDYIISIGVVATVEEAIEHISKYSTGHSECIVTEDYTNANKFTDEVDSACVYVNASTSFTDGNEFGLGAEIGISTQKLHARGPMGLKEITTTKYIILGNGQTRK